MWMCGQSVLVYFKQEDCDESVRYAESIMEEEDDCHLHVLGDYEQKELELNVQRSLAEIIMRVIFFEDAAH